MNPTTGMSSILVVDEDASIRDVVSKYLSRQGYSVICAATAAEALEAITQGSVPCMLLDLNVGGQGGIALIPQVHRLDGDVAIIMMSVAGDAATRTACIRAGALDVVAKPFDLAGLAGAVAQALFDRQDIIERRATKQRRRDDEPERVEQARREQAKLARHSAASLDALVFALESKDVFMAGHSMRVAQMAASIAAVLGHDDEDVEMMRLAGRLHDIGVVGISDGILTKPGLLTPAEFEEVKRHVTIGAQILQPYPHLGAVADFVRGHHERWDGTGYPAKLAGERIPWGARILAAAEIYDAITSARAYRERISAEQAIEEMRAMSGSTLEPAVFDALAGVVARGQALDFLQEAPGGESLTQMTHAESPA